MDEKKFPTDSEHEDDQMDLSLFEQAMSEIGADSSKPKSEYEVIHQVLQELSEKYGVEFTVHDGRALGSPMALNHRLDDFRYQCGGISDEEAIAIQANQFTYEMGQEVLEPITNPHRLFTKTDEELERMQGSAYQLIEALLYLGQKKYGNEEEFVQKQKDLMIGDIKSYDAMISTFSRYTDFINEYIERRPDEDRQPAMIDQLREWMKDEEDIADLEKRFPGYSQVRKEIDAAVNQALAGREGTEVLTSELRQIVRAYNSASKLKWNGSGFQPAVDQEELNRCVEYIQNA